jgi:hypothetical protein
VNDLATATDHNLDVGASDTHAIDHEWRARGRIGVSRGEADFAILHRLSGLAEVNFGGARACHVQA